MKINWQDVAGWLVALAIVATAVGLGVVISNHLTGQARQLRPGVIERIAVAEDDGTGPDARVYAKWTGENQLTVQVKRNRYCRNLQVYVGDHVWFLERSFTAREDMKTFEVQRPVRVGCTDTLGNWWAWEEVR